MERVKGSDGADFIDGMDRSSSQIIELIEKGRDSGSGTRALLYIRKISEPVDYNGPRFSDMIKNLSDQNGDSECELVFRNPDYDDESFWMKIKLNMLDNKPASLLFTAEFENISTKKSLEAQHRNEVLSRAIEAAHHDSSTGVYNKYFTEDIIRNRLAGGGGMSVLLILDIDLLKNINDTYGHPVGDAVLRTVAGIMRSQFGQDDIIGRVGGDEFMALVSGVGDETSARLAVERLLERIGGVRICGFRLGVSVGCVLTGPTPEDFDTLYRKADKALYHVKRNGRNNYDFYSSEND